VVTPEDAYLLEAGGSQPPLPCSSGQLNNLRGLALDVVRSAAGPFPFHDVQQNLDLAWRSQSALAMLLTALDAEHSSSLRSAAAGVAERLLAAPEVRERVRWRLLGTPLPREADLEGIWLQGVVRKLVDEAQRMSTVVALAGEVWDRLAFGSSIGPERLAQLRQLCILYGGFAECIASKPQTWLRRVPIEEEDLLEPAALEFLKRWSTVVLRRAGARDPMETYVPGLLKDRKKHNVA
jgi:hypothetical protein